MQDPKEGRRVHGRRQDQDKFEAHKVASLGVSYEMESLPRELLDRIASDANTPLSGVCRSMRHCGVSQFRLAKSMLGSAWPEADPLYSDGAVTAARSSLDPYHIVLAISQENTLYNLSWLSGGFESARSYVEGLTDEERIDFLSVVAMGEPVWSEELAESWQVWIPPPWKPI